MDREKVIDGIEAIREFFDFGLPSQSPVFEAYQNILTDALVMLKGQEAVEPKQIVRKQCKTEHSDGSVDYYAEWFCPHCNSLLKRGFDATWIEYCFKCGKPITWEGQRSGYENT